MVDLNTCKPGDKLVSTHGAILTYVGKCDEEEYYDHKVLYANASPGTRISSGHVYRNPEQRLPHDHDIIAILGEFHLEDERLAVMKKLMKQTAKVLRFWQDLYTFDNQEVQVAKDAAIKFWENKLLEFKLYL